MTRLQETVTILEKREAFLQTKIDKELAQAKAYMTQKNKRGTLPKNDFLFW
jgi:hypothetical protein